MGIIKRKRKSIHSSFKDMASFFTFTVLSGRVILNAKAQIIQAESYYSTLFELTFHPAVMSDQVRNEDIHSRMDMLDDQIKTIRCLLDTVEAEAKVACEEIVKVNESTMVSEQEDSTTSLNFLSSYMRRIDRVLGRLTRVMNDTEHFTSVLKNYLTNDAKVFVDTVNNDVIAPYYLKLLTI